MTEGRRRVWRYKGTRFTEKRAHLYTTAIGQIALVWNDFHEMLGLLFHTLLIGGLEIHHSKALAVWHSSKLDRPKREMIRGITAFVTESDQKKFPRMQEDIKWLLDRADEMEDARNNAIHSPLFLIPDGAKMNALREVGFYIPDVLPQTLFGNPRARRMEQSYLLAEYEWCHATIVELRDFAILLDPALRGGGAPWPDIPRLPDRPQKNTPQDQRRRRRTKQRAPHSRSSRV